MASKVKYEIDLRASFDRIYAGKTPEVRSKMRPLLNDLGVKASIAQDVIFEITERTQVKKRDKNNKAFKPYSESYAKSLAGQVAGKAQGQPANLTLSGEMIASIVNQSPDSRSKVRVGMADQLNNDKAHGHITGANGRLPVRDFLGLPRSVEDQIVKENIDRAANERFFGSLELEFDFDLEVGGQTAALSPAVVVDIFDEGNEE